MRMPRWQPDRPRHLRPAGLTDEAGAQAISVSDDGYDQLLLDPKPYRVLEVPAGEWTVLESLAHATVAEVAVARLAEVTADRWQEEAVRRRIVAPPPATVRWRWAAAEVAAPRREVTMPLVPGPGPLPLPGASSPGELLESGEVTRLYHEVYARLPPGRPVLPGGPGAGKTGTVILLLLLAALRDYVAPTGEPQAQMPMPVWLTLGEWNPLAESLQAWAAATMTRDHPFLRARIMVPTLPGNYCGQTGVRCSSTGLTSCPMTCSPPPCGGLTRSGACAWC